MLRFLRQIPESLAAISQPRRTRSFLQLCRVFVNLLGVQKRSVGQGLVLRSISTALWLVHPAIIKVAIDVIVAGTPLAIAGFNISIPPAGQWHFLSTLSVLIVVVSCLAIGLRVWGEWYITRASILMQASLRKRLFNHLLCLPLHRVQQLKSGGATSILREDVNFIASLVFSMMFQACGVAIQIAGTLVILVCIDWRILVGALPLVPAPFLAVRVLNRWVQPIHKEIGSQRQLNDGTTTEVLAGIRVVRGFGRARSEARRYGRNNHAVARLQSLVFFRSQMVGSVLSLAWPLCLATLLLYSGSHIQSGELTLGDLVMLIAYLSMLYGLVSQLSSVAGTFQAGLASLDRILDVLEEPIDSLLESASGLVVDKSDVRGKVKFRNVTFTYPGNHTPAVVNIELTVLPGEFVAIVGHSGAGKTTLINLIARHCQPDNGSIEIDDIDVQRIQNKSFRQMLGIVDQEVFLFEGTVLENIKYSRPKAALADVERALVAACADKFVAALDNGLNTLVGERGVRLSAGQRQRIGIARVILADPRILILDEAMSNLDVESELHVQRGLKNLMAGRTCFQVSHRLGAIADADRIIVLENGRIVECGVHNELMQHGGVYAQMISTGAVAKGIAPN
jgi:ATP-binding cassette subfamily B protein